MKTQRTHIIIFFTCAFVFYVLWQYSTFFGSTTENYYNTILNQARLCGRNIDLRLAELEEDANYCTFEFNTDNLFKLNERQAQEKVTSGFRRLYSQYQDLISDIYFTDGNSTLLFRKTDENYFSVGKTTKLLSPPSTKSSGFISIDGSTYFFQPYVTQKGNSPYSLFIEINPAGLVKHEFQKFYLGKNSYLYLVNNNQTLDYLFYSEESLSVASVKIDSLGLITKEILNGYEGKLTHSIVVNDREIDVISAFYPLKIGEKKYGIVFSIDEDTLLGKLNISLVKVIVAFVFVIGLIVYLFLHIIRQRDNAHSEYVKSEERQSHIVESLPDTLLLHDESGSITDIFNADEHLFEQIGEIYKNKRADSSFENKSVYNQYRVIFNKFKENNSLAVGEIRCGESSFFEVRVAPYSINKSITIFRDISLVKQAEIDLKLSHERFLTVINSIDAVIYVADIQTYEVLLVNDFTKAKFGDITGKLCYKTLWQANEDVCQFCVKDKLLDENGLPGKSFISEFHDTNTGEWYKVHDRAIQWYDGRIVKFQIAFNITEHKLALRQLKESEEKFRFIYESLLDVHFRTDIGGEILMVSPASLKLTDYKPEELIGKNASMLYADSNDRNKFVSRILQEGAIQDFETEIQKKNGEKISVSLNSRLVKDYKNHPLWIEGTLRDVSERNKTIRELKQAKIAAESADRTKSQFLASMSHELRTPLNGILGYTQILMQDVTLNTGQREGINIIHKSGEHLLNLINEILDLSKIDADKVNLEFAPFDLKEMVESIYQMVALKADAKKIKVNINFAENLPESIMQDEKRLKQVLINLLTNAVKFTEEGSITLEVTRRESFIGFSVADTGIGIPKNKQQLIFSPFEQLGDHLKKSEGTGLGLAISNKIVKLLGGNLSLESEPGKGSTFSFEIPVEIENNSQTIINTRQVNVSFEGNNKKVLVADDNDITRLVLTKMLQKKGLNIIEAVDGLDAYHKAREFTPDLVLIDMFMPNMDGVEATKKIKGDMNIPVILISATKYENDEQKVQEAGFDATLLKPVKREKLFELLSLFLSENSITTEKKQPVTIDKMPENYDIEILIEFIEKRKISRFVQYLDHLGKKDEEYYPFIDKLKQLANSFRLAEIKDMLEKHLTVINE